MLHRAAGDALYAMELSLSLEKLNFDKLLHLWEVGGWVVVYPWVCLSVSANSSVACTHCCNQRLLLLLHTMFQQLS